MVSIIILSYNAAIYTKHALKTLKNTEGVDYEVIVLDNNSTEKTKKMLKKMKKKGYIDKLIFEKENTFFAKGNNTASTYCDSSSKYILLLNSDVEIRDEEWLKILIRMHKQGATAYGVCETNPYTRGDGYCFLIDKDLYLKYKLDESFEWWWSVTKLQAELLRDGYNVCAVKNHDTLIYHYGGMSGTAWKKSKGMNIEGEKVKEWFNNKSIKLIDSIVGNKPSYNKYGLVNSMSKLSKLSKNIKLK